jgi:hypothetical protein
MSTPPSTPPFPNKPDSFGYLLKVLADESNILLQGVEEYDEVRRVWVGHRLINPDGSPVSYLGSSYGMTKDVAREHSALQALGELISLIRARTWKVESTMRPDTKLFPGEDKRSHLTVGPENHLVSGSLRGTEAVRGPIRTQGPGNISKEAAREGGNGMLTSYLTLLEQCCQCQVNDELYYRCTFFTPTPHA